MNSGNLTSGYAKYPLVQSKQYKIKHDLKSLLTDNDRSLICEAVYNLETCNFLLGRKTGISLLLMIDHLNWCRKQAEDNLNDINKEVLEYVEACYHPDNFKKYNEKYELCQSNSLEQR